MRERLIEEETQVQNVRLIFRNIKLNIQRLHIRYEDDYYQADLGKKFVFGLTLKNLFVDSVKENWGINQGEGNHFLNQAADKNRYPETSSDSANLLLKDIKATEVEIYLENNPEVSIPTEVLEAAH